MMLLALAAIITIASSSLDPASARIIQTFTEHMNALGSTIINVRGQQILIDAYHFDSGEFGSGDALRILCYQDTPIGPVLQVVAVFTDMPQRVNLLSQFYQSTPTSTQLVDPSDLQVCREGNSKTIMVVWETALEVPTETWWSGVISAFSIPPGRLVFRGHGDTISGSSTGTGAGGWIQTITWTGYYGNATFICPTWHFGGPVREIEGNPTVVYTDATLISNRIIIGL